MNINSSFTAASTIPTKLITNDKIVKSIKENNIFPMHVQLNPTNKCPLNCSFCSCRNRDKGAVMSLNTVKTLIDRLMRLGTEAITITGGGDPLAHPNINAIIEYAGLKGMKLGLVTNGVLFDKLDKLSIKALTWCRISLSQEHPVSRLEKHANIFKIPIDWAFSYVLTKDTKVDSVINAINMANQNCFTHVRIVDDILNNSMNIDFIKNSIKSSGIDDSKVIYQGRKMHGKGNKKCLISLLKPNIDANGDIYPCCVDENEAVMIERDGLIMNPYIKDLKIGDTCYPYGKIEAILKKPKEELLEIETETGRTVVVSKDHIMMTVNNIVIGGGKNKIMYTKYADSYDLIEKKAIDIKIGDVLPCQFKIKNNEIDTSIDDNLAKFLGYYVSEGWISRECIGLTPGKDPAFINDIVSCIEVLKNKYKLTYKIYNRRTTSQFMIYSKDLLKIIIDNMCGIRSNKKGVPIAIFNSSLNIKKSFLKGYFDGDGSSAEPRSDYNGYRINFTTVSRKLSSDLFLLLSQMGIYCTVHNDRRAGISSIEGRKVNIKDRYIIKVSGYYNLKKLKGVIDISPTFFKKSQKRAISFPKDKDIMFLKVKHIRTVNPTGEFLYDIKVADGNKFCTGIGQIIVHNCGIQYSLNKPSLDFDKRFIMGHISNIEGIYRNQKYFDGSVCSKCYYGEYNDMMNKLHDHSELKHKEFI